MTNNNVGVPLFSSSSKNGGTSNNSTSFTTLCVDSSVVSFNQDHPSFPSFANINSNNKLSPLLLSSLPSLPLPSSPSFLSSSTMHAIPFESNAILQESNENMEPQPNVVTLAKRPRGRPPGSKNKPKPTTEVPTLSPFIFREYEDFVKPIFLIVPVGSDIVDAVIDFGCKRDVCISVHHASGTISEVELCDPFSSFDDLSLKGNMQMLSLTGFYTKCLSPSPPNNIPYSIFNIQLSRGRNFEILSGLVGCKLIAAEPVHVLAYVSNKLEYQDVSHPIINPKVQPFMNNTRDNHRATNVSIDTSGIANNIVDYPGFVGAPTSSSMNVQPPTAPIKHALLGEPHQIG